LSIKGRLPIKGFIETSFIDWRGCLSSVIFTGGCNFRCPYCHNPDLVLNPGALEDIPYSYIFSILKKFKKWIHRVVVTGGEPTIHKYLITFLKRLKHEGITVKLDTNGSNPSVLKTLVKEGLIDYVAMDVKGPIERYSRWCGIDVDTSAIKESIGFLLEGHIDYEFRMTVVPFLHKEEDIYEVARYIRGTKRFYIQEFKARNTLNPSYSSIKPFPDDMLIRIKRITAEILQENHTHLNIEHR